MPTRKPIISLFSMSKFARSMGKCPEAEFVCIHRSSPCEYSNASWLCFIWSSSMFIYALLWFYWTIPDITLFRGLVLKGLNLAKKEAWKRQFLCQIFMILIWVLFRCLSNKKLSYFMWTASVGSFLFLHINFWNSLHIPSCCYFCEFLTLVMVSYSMASLST